MGFPQLNLNNMPTKVLTCEDGEQVLYDSVTMTAFGVVHERAYFDYEDFIEFLQPFDARSFTQQALNDKYYEWLKHMENGNE